MDIYIINAILFGCIGLNVLMVWRNWRDLRNFHAWADKEMDAMNDIRTEWEAEREGIKRGMAFALTVANILTDIRWSDEEKFNKIRQIAQDAGIHPEVTH